jgi:acid phosphatase (class A)
MKNCSVLTLFALLACISISSGCASYSAAVPELSPGIPAGYLQTEALPDSFALIPPPPAAGSAALALDEEVSQKSFLLRETPRWAQARVDANLIFPEAAGTFSCALAAPITVKDTPHLYLLLRRVLIDVGRSTSGAKSLYGRARPFAVNRKPSCTPEEEKYQVLNGSYPSGHAAVGWAWALILGEIAPDRIDKVLARGRRFGESREICNVHWRSDVIEGSFLGAGTVSRLHADPAFRDDLAAAKVELAGVRAKGLKPTRDCVAENAALAN